jgi:hypothetical protein
MVRIESRTPANDPGAPTGTAGDIHGEREMKTLLLAAAAVLTLGSASAFASDSGDLPATTLFTLQQQAPVAGTQVAHQAMQPVVGSSAAYATQSHNQGTWLFQPDALGGGN